jgi:hypothetical protein
MRSRTLRNVARVAALTALVATIGGNARAELIYGLGATANSPNLLFSFDSATPGTATTIGNISAGLIGSASESVVGIDFRPVLSPSLFALTNDGGIGRIYAINPTTAAATFVAQLFANPTDPTSPYTSLSGTTFGMDFNPTGPVALRIVSNTGQNLRVGNPLTGSTFTDTDLNGNIYGVAYTNNDNNPATGTTIYYLRSVPASGNTFLQTATDPNAGPATNVGAVGFGVEVSSALGFDISGLTGTAFAAVNIVGGGGSTFHTVDLGAGTQNLVGSFNTSEVGTVRGIAALANVQGPEPGSVALLGAGVGAFAVFLRRRARKG